MMLFSQVSTEEVEPFVKLMEEDSGRTNQVHIDMGRLFIHTHDADVGLMVRFQGYSKTLVIARIGFFHQRQGFGQRLLELLKKYGKKNGYDKIEIESMQTEDVLRFAQKYGFEPKDDQYKMFKDAGYYGSWVLKIS